MCVLLLRDAYLSYLDAVGVLKAGGQLLPGWGHGFAVAAPRGEELDEMEP